MISVTEAVFRRQSIRSFLKKPIPDRLLKSLLNKASRAPSGGNLQPWFIYVLNGNTMRSFIDFQTTWTGRDDPEYPIYPPKLKEPYRTSRFEVGEQLYGSLGIARDDKEARMKQMTHNFHFFGAPVGLFCFIDRVMNAPQWSDLGMFLQTFMLLAQEEGIDTCAQEFWSLKPNMVTTFVNADPQLMLFCGMAVGYRDSKSPLNQYMTARRPLTEWCSFVKK